MSESFNSAHDVCPLKKVFSSVKQFGPLILNHSLCPKNTEKELQGWPESLSS
jgi:hypothetical protein